MTGEPGEPAATPGPALADLESRPAVELAVLVEYLDAAGRVREELRSAIAQADRLAEERARARAAADRRQRVELGDLALAAFEELAELERVHAATLDAITAAGRAGAARILAAGEREADRFRESAAAGSAASGSAGSAPDLDRLEQFDAG